VPPESVLKDPGSDFIEEDGLKSSGGQPPILRPLNAESVLLELTEAGELAVVTGLKSPSLSLVFTVLLFAVL
jgi:hypothetical protein